MVSKENRANTRPPDTMEGVFRSLRVGVAAKAFHVQEYGLWLGAEKFNDAPFKVDMDGNVELTGYIQVGGAADDINTGTVTVDGGKITANTITADQIAANTISANEIAADAIVAEAIASDVLLTRHFKARQIEAGHIKVNAITANEIDANTITADEIKSDAIETRHLKSDTIETKHIKTNQITTNRINNKAVDGNKIDDLAITNGHIHSLSASKLTAGTISVGGASQPGALTIQQTAIGGTSYLTWRGGSTIRGRMAADSSGYLWLRGEGTSSTNGRIYLYCENSLHMMLERYNRSIFYEGVYIQSASHSTVLIVNGHMDPAAHHVFNCGGSSRAWYYVNAYGFRQSGGGFYDTPVKLRDGRVVDDIEALMSIKPRKGVYDKHTKRQLLDVRTFPEDVVRLATDEDGKVCPRDNNDRPLVQDPNTGSRVPKPELDGFDLGEFTCLLFGGFKQLVKRVEELEKANK